MKVLFVPEERAVHSRQVTVSGSEFVACPSQLVVCKALVRQFSRLTVDSSSFQSADAYRLTSLRVDRPQSSQLIVSYIVSSSAKRLFD